MRVRPSIALWVHGMLVAVLVAVFAVLALSGAGQPDANIGAGIALLAILGLGAPWTIPMIIDPAAFAGLPGPVWSLVAVGPAVLNVALHAALLAWWRRAGSGHHG